MLWPNPVPGLTPKQKRVLQISARARRARSRSINSASVAPCAAGPIRGLMTRASRGARVGRIENRRPAPNRRRTPRRRPPEPTVPLVLTADQTEVWAVLERSVREGGFKPFLLHGVTGSGKTELYLRAIDEVIRQGKEALVSRAGNQPDAANHPCVSRARAAKSRCCIAICKTPTGRATGGRSPPGACRSSSAHAARCSRRRATSA